VRVAARKHIAMFRKGCSVMGSTAATTPMKWSDKGTNGSMEHCSCCGRRLTGQPVWVEVIDGGSSVAAPGLDPDTNDPGYMGFFPVGRACGRKHFHGFTQDDGRASNAGR
jgi:hypothetical protein